MGFYRQFETFDPLAAQPPSYPFPALPVIAARARALLRGRTRDQITSAAKIVEFLVERYFADAKASYVREVLESDGWELAYLPSDERNEAGVRKLLENWPSDAEDSPPEFPSSDNTSDVEALKRCVDDYLLDDEDFPEGKSHELFAVLALWLVADSIKWLQWTSDPKKMLAELQELRSCLPPDLPGFFAPDIDKARADLQDRLPEFVAECQKIDLSMGLTDQQVQYSCAGSSALEAMDAVCYAEFLQRSDELWKNLELHRIHLENTFSAKADLKAREKISLTNQKAALQRHAENRAMKQQVFEWCESYLSGYRSMDAAAEALAGKVVPVTFRTARDWVGEYRKHLRSARTP